MELQSDGLHLSPRGSAVIASCILATLQGILGSGTVQQPTKLTMPTLSGWYANVRDIQNYFGWQFRIALTCFFSSEVLFLSRLLNPLSKGDQWIHISAGGFAARVRLRHVFVCCLYRQSSRKATFLLVTCALGQALLCLLTATACTSVEMFEHRRQRCSFRPCSLSLQSDGNLVLRAAIGCQIFTSHPQPRTFCLKICSASSPDFAKCYYSTSNCLQLYCQRQNHPLDLSWAFAGHPWSCHVEDIHATEMQIVQLYI